MERATSRGTVRTWESKERLLLNANAPEIVIRKARAKHDRQMRAQRAADAQDAARRAEAKMRARGLL